MKEAESIFYHFIWNGKDKVKHNAVISEVENGGLNMLDTESMIRTKRVICLQKFLEDHAWKFLIQFGPTFFWTVRRLVPNKDKFKMAT